MILFMGRPKVEDMGYGGKKLFIPSYFSHCLCCFLTFSLNNKSLNKCPRQTYLPNISFDLSQPGYPFHSFITSQPLLLLAPCFQVLFLCKAGCWRGHQQNLRSKNLASSLSSWDLKLYRAVRVDQDGPTEHSLAVKQGIHWNSTLPVTCA